MNLVSSVVNDCSKMLHHLCQNSNDHAKFDSSFEKKFGLVFRYLDCMSKRMMPKNITGNVSKPSNKVLDII